MAVFPRRVQAARVGKKKIRDALTAALHPRGWYDCATCPDQAKRIRHCRYDLTEPDPSYPDWGAECICPAYGIGASTYEALRASALLDRGVITLDDLDLHHLEAAEVATAHRARLTKERISGKATS